MYIKKNNDCKYIRKILLFILIFIFIKYISYIISSFKFLIFYLHSQNEIKKKNIYLKNCNNELRIIKKYSKKKNPSISILSPIYNKEKFILRFLKIIQYQNFNNLEIIFIDDNSKDNSIKIIEEYKKIDKRISIIKNKKNKGTFISRNIGILYSKGKYVILPDSDDVLNKKILNLCYKYAEKYNYEIIRFKMHKEDGIITNKINNELDETSMYQPELSNYMFYGNSELQIIDYYIHNKFIKKEIFIKALSKLTNFYFNMYITLWEDTIISFILYRTAKSFFFLKKIGYYYIKNSQSITKNMVKLSELKIYFIFIFLKLVFEYSKNTKFEKDMANLLFTDLNKNFNIEYRLSSLFPNAYFNLYKHIINMYLNCIFITKENKIILQKFKKKLEKK